MILNWSCFGFITWVLENWIGKGTLNYPVQTFRGDNVPEVMIILLGFVYRICLNVRNGTRQTSWNYQILSEL